MKTNKTNMKKYIRTRSVLTHPKHLQFISTFIHFFSKYVHLNDRTKCLWKSIAEIVQNQRVDGIRQSEWRLTSRLVCLLHSVGIQNCTHQYQFTKKKSHGVHSYKECKEDIVFHFVEVLPGATVPLICVSTVVEDKLRNVSRPQALAS